MGNGAEEGDSKVRERNEEADFNGHVGRQARRQARRQTELTDMPGFTEGSSARIALFSSWREKRIGSAGSQSSPSFPLFCAIPFVFVSLSKLYSKD